MCIYSTTFEIVFSLDTKDNNIMYVHVNIILDFAITYTEASVLSNQTAHVYTKQ